MKKRILLIIAAALALLLTLGLLSCGDKEKPSDETGEGDTSAPGETSAVEEPPVDENSRENAKDALPDDLNFNNEKLRFYYRPNFVEFGEYLEGESGGDIIFDAIYNRNLAVEERLGVELEFFTMEDDSPGALVSSILAGDDTIDAILHTEWKMVGLVIQGAFENVADEKYLDLTRDWWLPNVTSELNLLPDKTFLFTGEMLTENIGSMSAMYVNTESYEAHYGSIDDLHKLVLDGKWTHDEFYKYVEGAYVDADGNSAISTNDNFGFFTDTYSCVDNLTFSTDISFYTRDDEGLPVLNINTPRTLQLVEALYRLIYENKGAIIASEDLLVPQFVSGKSMFMGYRLNTSMKAEMRDMEVDYSIIPYPKLDESQKEYVSLIHNSSPVIAIPTTCKNVEMVCATLEALSAESYRTVTPAYYDTSLKTKYTRDSVSGQMIDLIYNGARKDLIYDMGPEKSGQITRDLMSAQSKDFTSYYKAKEPVFVASLENLIEQYKELD